MKALCGGISIFKRFFVSRRMPPEVPEGRGLLDLYQRGEHDALFMLFRHPSKTAGGVGRTDRPQHQLAERDAARIVRAYRLAIQEPVGDDASFWLREFAASKSLIHQIYTSGSLQEAVEVLADPQAFALTRGFDLDITEIDPTLRIRLYDLLIRICEAVGCCNLYNPELLNGSQPRPIAVEEALTKLDETLGFRVDFPNPFPTEYGLITDRGIASFRALQALYQAWRIFTLVDQNQGAKILEIGAGSGRTAYYLRRLGLLSYTIIDIPMTCSAQANFLMRTLGGEAVCLVGEENRDGYVSIQTPMKFIESESVWDLVVNIDSMTEMASLNADQYLEAIRQRASMFLSVNHEVNPIVVARRMEGWSGVRVTRHPYWLRRGYVEEVAQFN